MNTHSKKVALNGYLTFAIVITTLLPMFDYYGHSPTGTKAYDRFIFYFLIPLALLLLVYRANPREYGLTLGDWREGMLWVVGVGLVMGGFLWFFARAPEMSAYYTRAVERYGGIEWALFLTAVDLFAWEFIWRGFLLFILAKHLGIGPAIFLQAVPFAFMHLGKPELETYSTIFGGAGFGLIAWRTRSMIYPFLIHWLISGVTLVVATLV